MKGFLKGLQFAIKYGKYVLVVVDIVQFAYEKFEALEKENPTKDESK